MSCRFILLALVSISLIVALSTSVEAEGLRFVNGPT